MDLILNFSPQNCNVTLWDLTVILCFPSSFISPLFQMTISHFSLLKPPLPPLSFLLSDHLTRWDTSYFWGRWNKTISVESHDYMYPPTSISLTLPCCLLWHICVGWWWRILSYSQYLYFVYCIPLPLTYSRSSLYQFVPFFLHHHFSLFCWIISTSSEQMVTSFLFNSISDLTAVSQFLLPFVAKTSLKNSLYSVVFRFLSSLLNPLFS